MGDYRLSVKIVLMGVDGKEQTIDWWLNWAPDISERLYRDMVKAAKDAGLDVDDKTYLFNNGECD